MFSGPQCAHATRASSAPPDILARHSDGCLSRALPAREAHPHRVTLHHTTFSNGSHVASSPSEERSIEERGFHPRAFTRNLSEAGRKPCRTTTATSVRAHARASTTISAMSFALGKDKNKKAAPGGPPEQVELQ
eukprot:4615494-Prymnesium_polylepis.2